MSQYLQFYLKHKESNIKLSAGYFCTTPARQIADIGSFPYTEDEKVLTNDCIKLYISNIESEIDSIKVCKETEHKHKQELLDILYKCNSKDATKTIYDKVCTSNILINGYTEALEDWEYRLNKIKFIFGMYDENKEDWDLYYINC